jgi:hypothetical protein
MRAREGGEGRPRCVIDAQLRWGEGGGEFVLGTGRVGQGGAHYPSVCSVTPEKAI